MNRLLLLALLGLFAVGCGGSESKEFQTEEEKVLGCMSKYNNSIFEFEYEVKKLLNDPDSFEHIETGANLDGLTPKVRMKFRAKNAMGGYITKYATADLDPEDCSVSKVNIL